MKPYQREFIEFAIQQKALLFGEFVLKSKRISPYFFNTGLFNTGLAIAKLGEFYAQAIINSGIEYDMLFGPAYKGIPLVTSVAIALAQGHQINKHYAFNRKEKKDHAEGGLIVGSAVQGKVLVVDDVISAGVTVKESVELIRNENATWAGQVILFDRQERGLESDLSAVEEVKLKYHGEVISVVTLKDLMTYLEEIGDHSNFALIKDYTVQYGSRNDTHLI
jgi:orotate phosphoribosyltransferase